MKISTPTTFVISLFALGSATLHAVDYTWTNSATALWTATNAWSPTAPAGGPTGTDNVIGTPGNNLQLGAASHSISNFTATTTTNASWALQSGATVASTLNVLGTFTMNSDKNVLVQRNPGATTATLSVNAANISVVNTNGAFFLGNTGEATGLDSVSVSGATTVNAGARLRMNVTNSANLGALTANGLVSLVTTTNNDISRTVAVTSLSGAGQVNGNASSGLNSSATLIINGASTTTFSGVIANGNNSVVSLTKSGAGVQRLTGNNTYSGPTTVNAGSLIIDGTNSGAGVLTVSSGATLGGSGTIGAATTISGIHSPGNSAGVQTFADGLSYAAGSTFVWELFGNTAGGRGTSFDGVDVTGGTLTINSGVTSSLVFDASGSTVLWSDGFWDSNQTWLVFDNANAPSILGSPSINIGFDSLGNDFAIARAGSSFEWEVQGNDLYLNYTVPEPSTYALLALAAAGLGAHVIRRRRHS